MTVFATVPVTDQGTLGTVRGLLGKLLTTGIVDSVLVPLETRDGRSVQPGLVYDPARLAQANPLMPILPISGARMASLLTERDPVPGNGRPAASKHIAVVMRPCELRATVELAKLNQVQYGQLFTVAVDCVGTFEAPAFRLAAASPAEHLEAVLEAAKSGRAEAQTALPYRHACTICEWPTFKNADLSLHTIGVDGRSALLVEAVQESLLSSLGLAAGADSSEHARMADSLRKSRRERRAAELEAAAAQFQLRPDGTPGLVDAFETCQRCHNCTVACPICYCKECLFRTNTFAYEPSRFVGWAKRKGAARLPGDTIAFQLTRMTHMSTSCVGCGLCTSACPAGLPVDLLFQAAARRTQALFDYEAGRDLSETVPMATFKQKEFVKLGESEH